MLFHAARHIGQVYKGSGLEGVREPIVWLEVGENGFKEILKGPPPRGNTENPFFVGFDGGFGPEGMDAVIFKFNT